MKEMYSINDIATMTGLSTRTIRSYMKLGLLDGEKYDGVWRFTLEDFDAFISNKNVKPSIQAKRNGVVYDFTANTLKKAPELCVVLDDYMDKEASLEVLDNICDLANSYSSLKFTMEKNKHNVRIILSGAFDEVYDFLGKYRSI